jgi:tetratricopeptide (TPR) repeat protein
LPARVPEVCAALLALAAAAGCAGGESALRTEQETLRSEVRALREQNEALSTKVDALGAKLDALAARGARPAAAPAREDAEKGPVIPPDLAVVRVEPRAPAPRSGRTPPPVPTAVAIAEPDAGRIEALSRRGSRDLAAEAEGELRRARARSGEPRAHALEDFAARYPRHPSADNALVEASAAYAELGRGDAACALARRAADDYPAGDALSDALERLAWCESRRGARDAERRLLERLVTEFPRTPAAQRAGTRLATISGRTGDTPDGPGRSGP